MDDRPLSASVAISIWSPSGGDHPLAIGTLIEGDVAVTPFGLSPQSEYRVAFGDETSSSRSGQLRAALPGLDLITITVSPSRDALPIGEPAAGECESIFPVEAPMVRTGIIQFSGRVPFAQFKGLPNEPALVHGAPIVSNGKLVGVLGEKNEIIPASTIVAALHVDEFDNQEVFANLDPTSRRVLEHARGVAGGRRAIHAEHLILGLNENPANTTRRLMVSRGIDDLKLRQIILEAVKTKPLGESEYTVENLTALPAMSAHVRRAVGIARIAAMRNREKIRPRHLLFGLLSVTDCAMAQTLEKHGIRAADVQMKGTTRISGYVSDVADGNDYFGVWREAHALAAVLGASKVAPPIAVGLLGTWGSGKSFFMHELRRRLVDVECRGKAGDPESCSNIVQIWFNAWHYIDTSLWASLTSTIFDTLDEELSIRENKGLPAEEAADRRARVLAEKATLESERAAVAAKRVAAEKELAAVAAAREAVRTSEEGVLRRAGKQSVAELVQIVTEQDKAETEAAIQAFTKSFGVDEKTAKSFHGTFGRLRAIFLALRKRKGWRVWVLLALAAMATIAAFYASQLVAEFRRWIEGASGVTVVAVLGWLVAQANKYRPEVDALLDKIEPLLRTSDEVIARMRERQLAELATRNSAVAARVAELKTNEANLEQCVQAKEQELVALQPMQQMKSFVRERRESSDYTKHLGVISKAHQDFDRLSRYLRTVTRADASGETKPLVDRIVLYIDDLDRCPEEKVVDVLQAVHLLLAFPLFVVVVGVDSRWLLHSLQARMKQFGIEKNPDRQKNENDETLWESTPINYLEKIFQIPFTLRQMESSGFDDLIDDLTMPTDAQARSAAAANSAASSGTASATAQAIPRLDPSGNPILPSGSPTAGGDNASTLPDTSATAHLNFTPAEIAYMKALYPLMPSPRGAKRFVNLYRLFRALLDDYRYASYTSATEAQYEAALLLLAMLIGFPEETTDVLASLVSTKPSGGWWNFVMKCVNSSGPLATKLTLIRENVKRPAESRSCEHFILWAPEIARYSFHSGRVISDYRAGAAASSSPIVPGPGLVASAQPGLARPASAE